MRTYTYNLMATNGLMTGIGGTYAGRGYTVTGIKAKAVKRVKNVALFLVAPLIGLAYLIAFPIIGIALLAWTAAKAVMNNAKARPLALALAAPFVGLAFVTVGPIAGLGALAWIGAKAALKR